MKVGLYIPCFNAAGSIRFCLEAVFKQTLPPQEVLVIDDGSSDETSSIASSYPVRIVTHADNLGLSAARNTAIKNLDTKFIASLDADCIPEPDWLERLMETLSSAQVAGVGGRLLESYSSTIFDSWRTVHMKQDWGEERTTPSFLFGANTVFRKKNLLEVGLYNLKFRNNYEDVDLCNRLKKKGYTFIYEPKAMAHHYKSDDFHSLLNTYWRWNYPYYQKNKYYSGPKKFIFKLKDNLGLANRYLEEDMCARRYKLLYLDFLLAIHHSWKDFEYFVLRKNQKEKSCPPVSYWLSLLDLNFFYHFDSRKNKLSTFLHKSESFLQNFFALDLLLGRQIQEKFSYDFKKLLYKHLLLSVYKIQDDYLLDRLLVLNERCTDWDGLLKKSHPYLDKIFLQNLSLSFRQWLEELSNRFKNITHMIEISAAKTDKISYAQKGEVQT